MRRGDGLAGARRRMLLGALAAFLTWPAAVPALAQQQDQQRPEPRPSSQPPPQSAQPQPQSGVRLNTIVVQGANRPSRRASQAQPSQPVAPAEPVAAPESAYGPVQGYLAERSATA